MTSYESGTPRVTCAIAAIAMTAITIGVMVVLPAKMEPDSQTFVALAMSQGATSKQCNPARSLSVEAVTARQAPATAVLSNAELKCRQQG